MHEILIPIFADKFIIQIEFVGSSSVVVLLSHTGQLIFIDVAEAKFVGQLQGKHTFKSFSLSPDGAVLSTVLADTKYVVSLFRIDPFLTIDVLAFLIPG